MAIIWVTYAWADNQYRDIDFIVQELESAGVKIKLDRWNIKAGRRLWDQIAEFIQTPAQCDAWLLIATQASLGSEPCREEYAYALDRALHSRSTTFPVIALFLTAVDPTFIPAGISTRLHVSIKDPDWKERIVAAAEGRDIIVNRPRIEPYHLRLYRQPPPTNGFVIEVRPRAGSWSPFIAAIPLAEKNLVKPYLGYGASGQIPAMGSLLFMSGEMMKNNWMTYFAQNEATPTMSYYFFCSKLPSTLFFGRQGGEQYTVDCSKIT